MIARERSMIMPKKGEEDTTPQRTREMMIVSEAKEVGMQRGERRRYFELNPQRLLRERQGCY